MTDQYYDSYRYKLRSSGLTPVGAGKFIVQTFGVDEYQVRLWPATTKLPSSNQFAGSSVSGRCISASFHRLPFLTAAGEQVFSGQIVYKPKFVDESRMPGGGL